jgi:hypothetical protein
MKVNRYTFILALMYVSITIPMQEARNITRSVARFVERNISTSGYIRLSDLYNVAKILEGSDQRRPRNYNNIKCLEDAEILSNIISNTEPLIHIWARIIPLDIQKSQFAEYNNQKERWKEQKIEVPEWIECMTPLAFM